MVLTLPFELGARIQGTPVASMLIKGTRFDGFAVSEPVYAEIPVVVAHCSRCDVVGDRAVASCVASDCPSRDRKAA